MWSWIRRKDCGKKVLPNSTPCAHSDLDILLFYIYIYIYIYRDRYPGLNV